MTQRLVKAKVRAGILIPLKQLDEFEIEKLQNDNTWHNYLDPYACRNCAEDSEKPENCGNCEFYEKHTFYQRKVIKGEPVMVINKGFRRKLESFFEGEIKVLNKQGATSMSTDKYRFDYTMLNEGQKSAHDDLVRIIQDGYSGILKSPARTGKTVMAASIIMTLNRRTIFIAHQEDLLIGKGQLITTFTGKTSATAPINPDRYFTNLYKFLAKGKTPIKYCRTLEDFLTTDICLTTYQVFLHPRGQKILEQIKDKFGLLVVDEVHKSASPRYSAVLNKFTCPRLGLTATPKRKDRRHRIMHSIFGEVEHATQIDSLTPTVSVVRTGFVSKKMYKNWVFFLRFLEQTDKRMATIYRFIYKDVKINKRSILIPVAHHSQVDSIVETLNDMGVKAIGWDGRLKKKERHIPLEKSANGEVDVIVAQRSMLTGINIPRWDMLYWIVPMNNDPNFEQEYKRVCTPMPGKKDPVVRFFVDDHEVVERCYFNSAKVIKDQGGKFTKSALEDWTAVGEKFGKLSKPKPKSDKVKSCKPSKNGKMTAPTSLFGTEVELDEDDAPIVSAPVKKTSHLKRIL